MSKIFLKYTSYKATIYNEGGKEGMKEGRKKK